MTREGKNENPPNFQGVQKLSSYVDQEPGGTDGSLRLHHVTRPRAAFKPLAPGSLQFVKLSVSAQLSLCRGRTLPARRLRSRGNVQHGF